MIYPFEFFKKILWILLANCIFFLGLFFQTSFTPGLVLSTLGFVSWYCFRDLDENPLFFDFDLLGDPGFGFDLKIRIFFRSPAESSFSSISNTHDFYRFYIGIFLYVI